MEHVFLTILNMSAAAGVVILLVLLARLLLRKAPKIFSYALWAVVLFRLLCPFTIPSPFSLLPAVQTAPAGAELTQVKVYTGVAAVNGPVNEYLSEHPYPVEFTQSELDGDPSAQYLEGIGRMVGAAAPGWTAIACRVWIIGAAALLGYSLLAALRLRRRLAESMPLEGEKHVRIADRIPSPFVLGLFRATIYLPSGLPEGERDYILLHERTHIRRLDHIFRALAWLALALHWFNPLVWLAFHLAGRDMEMSCDEAVLRKMDRDVRADYSSSLLRLSTGKRLPAGPLAFGDGDPQSRIKNVLSYKKPALWVVAAALIVVVGAGVALATNPGVVLDSPEPDDGLSYAFSDDRAYVAITGGRPEELWWSVPNQSEFLPQGVLSFGGLTLSNGWEVFGAAHWTSEDRNAVKMELHHTEGGAVTLDYTVLLAHAPEQSIIQRQVLGQREKDPHLSDQEVVELAEQFAYYLRAVEEFYANARPASDLTLFLDESDPTGPVVRIGGTVGGVELTRGAFWYPEQAVWGEHPMGELSMMYPPFTDGIEGHTFAWWADEAHTSVTLSTHMTALFSSLFNVGWWEFTVNLSDGTVTEMSAQSLRRGLPDSETRMYPESITDEEAVQAARVAAKLMTAAEDYYNNSRRAQPSAPLYEQYTPSYRCPDNGNRVIIDGLSAYVEWDNVRGGEGAPENAVGILYFSGDPACFYPGLAGEVADGYACWMDGNGTVLYTSFSVKDDRASSGTVAWFSMEFTVDLNRGTVTQRDFQSEAEGEALELTDQEMAYAAQALASVMNGAKGYYYDSASTIDAPAN